MSSISSENSIEERFRMLHSKSFNSNMYNYNERKAMNDNILVKITDNINEQEGLNVEIMDDIKRLNIRAMECSINNIISSIEKIDI
jgi:hypothetical protein